MERKEKFFLCGWALAVLYALFASLYTTLFGCTCPDVTVMGDCHRVHLSEILGSVGWILLVPAGMWLFRKQKGILRTFGTYIGALLACSGLWLVETAVRTWFPEHGFRYRMEGLAGFFLFPLHGLKGLGLSDPVWMAAVLVWGIGLWIFSDFLEKKYHPRTEKIRITFDGVYKFAFVLLFVVHLLFVGEALDLLAVTSADRLPEIWYTAVTALWLAVMTGGLRHFRHSRWMEVLLVLSCIRSAGLLLTMIGFCLPHAGLLAPFALITCTSPMLLPVELFWNLLSYGPPEEVICAMALVLELAVLLAAWMFYRRDFPRETKTAALPAGKERGI